MPRALLAAAPLTTPPNCVTMRRLARERGCTVHRVLVAIATRQLRTRQAEGRLYVDAASAAKWDHRAASALVAA